MAEGWTSDEMLARLEFNFLILASGGHGTDGHENERHRQHAAGKKKAGKVSEEMLEFVFTGHKGHTTLGHDLCESLNNDPLQHGIKVFGLFSVPFFL